MKAGGGLPAIWYALRKGREAGGIVKLYKALRTNNVCKTCALGMGGQRGGMVNEVGHFPEVCKKSIQAMVADMQGDIPDRFFETVDLLQMSAMTPRELEAMGRLTKPLYAGPLDQRYRALGWDEAIDRIATRMKNTPPDESFFYVSGRSSNEAGFLLQLLARLYGTNNVNNCSYYCHQASGVGLASVTGSGTATIVLDDLEGMGKGDVLFLIGANPASNHPRLMTTLVRFKRRGGRIVVVNPLRETGLVRFKVPSDPRSLLFGSRIADEYLQPHIGGDIALLTGIAKRVVEKEGHDEGFIAAHTEGWDEFRRTLDADWGTLEILSGVSKADLARVGDLYAQAPNAIFCWAMGVTHHANGVENVQAIANLAMVRGMLGRPKAGLLPLRGHSNVQGIGSMGVTPGLKQAVIEAMESEFAETLPAGEGLDTMACMLAADAGEVRLALCLGGNLFGSNPDTAFAGTAMHKIDLVVYLSTTLNTGHVGGRGKETIILPVLARDEEPQATTQESMFNLVRLSDGGPARHEGPRPEVSVIADLGSQVLPDSVLDWDLLRDHGRIRNAIARVIPGFGAMAGIDGDGGEFHIEGRTFHEATFATPTGKAVFHAVDLPRLLDGEGQLRLMTVRSEGQFNTVVYEEEDLYRGQERRDVILMAREDIERLGLAADQVVAVDGEAGSLEEVRVRAADIRAGNAAMYYPEANVLVPRRVDPASKTPAFKSSLVTIRA